MKTLELKKASKALADYATHLGEESIVITSNRKPVAALVSLRGVERQSLALSLNPAFRKIIRRARAEVSRGEAYSLDQIKQEMLTKDDSTRRSSTRTRRNAPRR